jgi:hypothetical protein
VLQWDWAWSARTRALIKKKNPPTCSKGMSDLLSFEADDTVTWIHVERQHTHLGYVHIHTHEMKAKVSFEKDN